MAVGDLGARERDDEGRVVPPPVEEVGDERDEPLVRPVDVLEHHHQRPLLGQALEEPPPGREEVLAVGGRPFGEPEQVEETRLDPRALVRVRDVELERGPQLRGRAGRVLVLEDLRTTAHHLGERPVGDPVAVGEAAAAVPPDVRRQAVDVLLELPGEAGLADPGDADDRDEPGARLVGGGVEEVLDEPQLRGTADERRLESRRAALAATLRRDAERLPEVDGLALALELVLSGVAERDRGLGCAARRLAHEHRAGLRAALWTREAVLTRSPVTMPCPSAPRVTAASPVCTPARRRSSATPLSTAEDRHGVDEVERGAHRALGVVLPRHGRAPERHHRVADELLDGAAVALDHRPGRVEVPRLQLPHVLEVAALRDRGVADEVGEQHGDETPLRGRGRGVERRAPGRIGRERRPALAAELHRRPVRCAARRARACERAAALAAEFPARLVLRATGRTEDARHRLSLARWWSWAKPGRYARPVSEKPPKPGAIADAEALGGSDAAQAQVRRWWRLVPRRADAADGGLRGAPRRRRDRRRRSLRADPRDRDRRRDGGRSS